MIQIINVDNGNRQVPFKERYNRFNVHLTFT